DLDDDLLSFAQELLDFVGGMRLVAPRLRSSFDALKARLTYVEATSRFCVCRPIASRLRSPFGALRARRPPLLRLAVVLVELLELRRVEHVVDVQKAVALEAEIDEGRLHAGQHLRDPSLVHIADDAALTLALDEDFRHEVVL